MVRVSWMLPDGAVGAWVYPDEQADAIVATIRDHHPGAMVWMNGILAPGAEVCEHSSTPPQEHEDGYHSGTMEAEGPGPAPHG